MKFLLLTVALLHCASAASEGKGPSEGPPAFKPFKDLEEAHNAPGGHYRGYTTVGKANQAAKQAYDKKKSQKEVGLDEFLQNQQAKAQQNLGLGELGDGGLDDTDKVMNQEIYLFLTQKCEACPPKETKNTSMTINGKKYGGDNEVMTTLGNCKTCGDPETGEYPKRYNRTDVSFGIPLKFAARSKWLNRIFQGDKDYKNVLDGNTQEDEFKSDPQAKKVEFNKFPNYDVPATATVSEDTLKYVVNYLIGLGDRVPREITKPIRSNKILECIDDADHVEAQAMEDLFDGAGKQAVFDVILAANYMEIESLLHLGCVKIATLIKGKTPEVIRQILGDDDASAAPDMRRRLLDAMSKAL